MKNKSRVCEIVKKEEESLTSLAVTPRTAKVITAAVQGKCTLSRKRHGICEWKTWREGMFLLTTMSCARNHWAYGRTSARGPLEPVTPNHLLQVKGWSQQGILRGRERGHSHNLYYSLYCNCPVLSLLTVVNLFLCLIYKWNFIRDITYRRKHSIYRVSYYLGVQASPGGLWAYPPQMEGGLLSSDGQTSLLGGTSSRTSGKLPCVLEGDGSNGERWEEEQEALGRGGPPWKWEIWAQAWPVRCCDTMSLHSTILSFWRVTRSPYTNLDVLPFSSLSGENYFVLEDSKLA